MRIAQTRRGPGQPRIQSRVRAAVRPDGQGEQ
jgi:hypothetical protein